MHRPYVNNKNRGFRNSCAIETGLSDFDKMTVSVILTKWQSLFLNVIFRKRCQKLYFIGAIKIF